MPTITESKLYPRRTLRADDFQAIRLSDQSSNESPDLGPPPVARFDYEDPVKQASPSPVRAAAPVGDEDVLPASLAVNFETRRKRKDGSSRLEIRRHSILPQSPGKAEGEPPASAILRTGAKRKLADRESDKPIKPPSNGDFTFSRKANGDDARGAGRKMASAARTDEPVPTSPKPSRKVLGDKSVNMSPKKASSKMEKPDKDKDDTEKPTAVQCLEEKDHAAGRRRRTSSIPLPSPPRNDVVNTVEILPLADDSVPTTVETDPKTPATLDLFSPTTSEPSGKPEGRGDTPPPADLSALSITTDGGDVRPSRRARATVNYAEPSLISKIRRPDKKMVDAISGLQDTRRAMNVSGTKRTSTSAPPTSEPRTVKIKQEPVDDEEAWKRLPSAGQSPLHPKSNGVINNQVLPSPTPTEDVSAPYATSNGYNTSALNSTTSATSATISALMAGSRKRRQSSQQPLGTDIDVDGTAKKLQDLDIYEFKDSSSPLTDGSAASGEAERPKASLRAKAHQRRHSTVVKDGAGVSGRSVASTGTREDEGSRPVSNEDSTAAAKMRRRRSMML
jgi:hypothetical protein